MILFLAFIQRDVVHPLLIPHSSPNFRHWGKKCQSEVVIIITYADILKAIIMNLMSKVFLLMCLVMMTASCAENKQEQKNESMIVNIASATKAADSPPKEFSFISKPFRTSNLSFRVGGPISNFETYVGNYFRKGNLIAQIDPRDFHIRETQAEARYKQSRAEFNRIKALYEKGNISASTFEKANADYVNTEMGYQTRVNELNDTRLTAPFNGYVSEVFIEKHQDVKATQTIISLVDLDQLKIEFYVTQDIAFNSGELEYIDLTFDAMPGVLYRAEIAEISKSATQNNLSYLITAILSNPDRKLLAGMSGMAFINASTSATKPITISQSALCHNQNDGDYVWIIDTKSSSVSKRSISIGDILPDGSMSIISGLKENEVVATSGLRFLSNGTKVQFSENNNI